MATVRKPKSKITMDTHFECPACGAANKTQICPHCGDGDGEQQRTRRLSR